MFIILMLSSLGFLLSQHWIPFGFCIGSSILLILIKRFTSNVKPHPLLVIIVSQNLIVSVLTVYQFGCHINWYGLAGFIVGYLLIGYFYYSKPKNKEKVSPPIKLDSMDKLIHEQLLNEDSPSPESGVDKLCDLSEKVRKEIDERYGMERKSAVFKIVSWYFYAILFWGGSLLLFHQWIEWYQPLGAILFIVGVKRILIIKDTEFYLWHLFTEKPKVKIRMRNLPNMNEGEHNEDSL